MAQEPKKHHYLPESYLTAWTGSDGRLERYVKRKGVIHTRRFTTGQVGYRTDLYRLLSAAIQDKTAIERHHFEKLDNAVAPVFARMNHDWPVRFTDYDKEVLAQFCLSLPARSPCGIALGQKLARDTYGLSLSDAEFNKDIGLAPNRNLWKQIEADNPHIVADLTLVHLIEVSTNRELIDRLVRMNWAAWNVSDSPIDLIVSDQAFKGNGDLRMDRGDNVVAIPIGPHRFITCSSRPYGGGGLRPVELVRIMNREAGDSAAEYIFATDRKHIALAKSRLREFGTWSTTIKPLPVNQ